MTGTTDRATIDWLLDSDPALRWQVERDLAGEPESVWQATRARVAGEGFGARLLAHQDPDGQWAGGAYFPAGFFASGGPEGPQPWTATTWSLNALREWGVDAAVLGDTGARLAANSRWEYDDLPYWGGEVDACINGFTLANGAWLGADVAGLAAWFVEHRMPDGGWNCEWVDGATVSSFHSTLNSLEGVLDAEIRGVSAPGLPEARHAAEEYLLERRLIHRLSTGEPVGAWVEKLEYPFRWEYTALRAVDHFRAASLHDGTAADPRIDDAVSIVRDSARADGRWAATAHDPGRVWFEVDAPLGAPSKWLTFTAVRALEWFASAR